MDNERNARGVALCPICGNSFSPSAPVLRVCTYMVHLECAPQAQQQIAAGTLATRPAEAS